MWETALLCRPPSATAGVPATDVGNSPTLQAAGRHSGCAGDRCGKQPYLAGSRAPQRVRQACETALNHGQAGAATDVPMPVWETALHGSQPGATAGAPKPGVGNGPTLRIAGRSCGRSSAECGKQPYFAGRRTPQRVRRRQMWETALLLSRA